MIEGTCSLCKGHKQTGSLMSHHGTPFYITTLQASNKNIEYQ